MKIIVLASGSGSNFHNLSNNFDIECLICNNDNAYCINYAKQLDIDFYIIKEFNDLFDKLKEISPDLICLAGYMKKLPSYIVEYFDSKIINLHPSLLPKHKGLNAFERSFQSDRLLGATVHYVDAGLDTGKIIKQSSFINTNNYDECIKILKQHEFKLYIDVVKNLKKEYYDKKSID